MRSSDKNKSWFVAGILFLIAAVVAGVLLWLNIYGCEGDVKSIKKKPASVTTENVNTFPSDTGNDTQQTVDTTPPEPEQPLVNGEMPSDVWAEYAVDFTGLEEINEDIHAWIKIPGTPVDYPILQSDDSELFYERRDYTGSYSVSGCIFTQYYNRKDFSDRNTLVYGHYMLDGTFFGSLHNYKDEEFFDENRYIYVSLPDRVLVYDIFAAYEYDNRHILASFNFNNDIEYAEYLNSCLNPSTMVRNVREGVELTIDDRIITLSTCTSYTDTSRRYLVQGVLIADVEA